MNVVIVIAILILVSGSAFALESSSSQDSSSLPTNSNDPGEMENPFTMSARLSAVQIGQYASDAGFTGDDLAVAVAVALAESGGNPQAYNPETAANTPVGMGSYGLWQIYRKAHPEFGLMDLTDPAQNAIAAFKVYSAAGFSFRPWSTFNSLAYQDFLSMAEGAVNA